MNIYAAIQLIGVQNCNDLTKNWILGLGGRLEEKACEPKPKNGLAWLGLGLARAVSIEKRPMFVGRLQYG